MERQQTQAGVFITFEGVEGCGKTTQLDLAARSLAEQGVEVRVSREPGGTSIGDAIRSILLDPASKVMHSECELFLYLASRAQHVRQVIIPALEAGTWVLCDRFTDATLAYQGYARGLDLDGLRALNDRATGGLKPDLTIVLDCPPEIGIERATKRMRDGGTFEAEGRFEQEKLAFHRRVREGYRRIAELEPGRVRLMEARGGIDEVSREIWRHMAEVLRTSVSPR